MPKGSELVSASGFTIPDASLFNRPDKTWEIDDSLVYALGTERVDPASQTHISEENGKTVFGNWVQTPPGGASQATFTYRLPFKVEPASHTDDWMQRLKQFAGFPTTDAYSLLIQKQSGVIQRTTDVTMHIPSALRALWTSGDPEGTSYGNAEDALFSALFEPTHL